MPSWDPQWLDVLRDPGHAEDCLRKFGYSIWNGNIRGNGLLITPCESILIDYLCLEWDYCFTPLSWEEEPKW